MRLVSFAIVLSVLAVPALARDALGVFDAWAAFRDPGPSADGPRCYAIAMAEPSAKAREFQPYADVATWPRKGVRGQVHFRLSRRMAPNAPISLSVGGQRFALAGGGAEAWAADRRMDAAVVAAIRSAESMTVSSRDAKGNLFSNTFTLKGAASAMDAATLACAKLR